MMIPVATGAMISSHGYVAGGFDEKWMADGCGPIIE